MPPKPAANASTAGPKTPAGPKVKETNLNPPYVRLDVLRSSRGFNPLHEVAYNLAYATKNPSRRVYPLLNSLRALAKKHDINAVVVISSYQKHTPLSLFAKILQFPPVEAGRKDVAHRVVDAFRDLGASLKKKIGERTTVRSVVLGTFRTYPLPSDTRRKMKNQVLRWEGPDFVGLQSARRRGHIPAVGASQANRYIARYMRDLAYRTPHVPLVGRNETTHRPIRYLYRGIKDLTKIVRGTLVDGGYMAFSHDLNVSKNFAKTHGVVFRVAMSDFPPGVPWIWFSDHGKAPSRRNLVKLIDEREVLLPPGKLKIKGTVSNANLRAMVTKSSGPPILDAVYVPDRRATSLGGLRIFRDPSTKNDDDELALYFYRMLFDGNLATPSIRYGLKNGNLDTNSNSNSNVSSVGTPVKRRTMEQRRTRKPKGGYGLTAANWNSNSN